MSLRTIEGREAMLRAVLAMDPTVSTRDAAEELGIHRSTFVGIRLGKIWADVLPELPRLTQEQTIRRCEACAFWDASVAPGENPCNIKIPERLSVGPKWARACGTYMAREEVAGGTTVPAQNEEPSGGNTVAGSGS